jgi:FkbM family methyltransferase
MGYSERTRKLIKQLIVLGCGPKLQHKIRRLHTVHQIIHNRHARELEMALINSLVSSGDFVADIGANVGVYSIELSRAVGSQGRVYSFEPVGENYDILTTLLSRAHLDNVSAFHVALGSKLKRCDMVVPEMPGFTGYYWAHVAKPGELGRRESVDVLTLDEFCRREIVTRLDFIKCDVEGGELEVILGGREIIESQRPGWLMEVSRDTNREVFQFLQGLGYRAFVLDGQLSETASYRDKEFSNYFFFHPQSPCWGRALRFIASADLSDGR